MSGRIIQFRRPERPDKDLWPELRPTYEFWEVHLVCGKCGYDGIPQWWYYDGDEFQPLCDCPLEATLTA